MLLIFSFQEFSRSIILADYNTNIEKYQRACVNKARPKLHCNGKCQMIKKMNAGKTNAEDSPGQPVKPQLTEHVLSSSSFFPDLVSLEHRLSVFAEHCNNKYHSRSLDALFRPPSL